MLGLACQGAGRPDLFNGMSAPENILRKVRMLVTDADGTLMGGRPEFDQFRTFRTKISELRNTYGATWVVCTGRSLRGYQKIFQAMNRFGIVPDYVIARHAYIYECGRHGFLPHWIWNLSVLWLQWKDDFALRRAMPELKKAVLASNPFVRVTCSTRQRLCFRFDDEAAARYGAEIIRAKARPFKYLQVFETPDEIEVRVIPFTKGLAVSELARHLELSTSQILVVGDGHNDISMLEMQPPCFTACPANAVSEVVEAVHRTGGHIASERSLAGVIEALSAYEAGVLNDQLPDGWIGNDRTPTSHRPHGSRGGLGTVILLLVVLYTTLLAIAHFFNYPGAQLVMKPYLKVVELMQGLVKQGGR